MWLEKLNMVSKCTPKKFGGFVEGDGLGFDEDLGIEIRFFGVGGEESDRAFLWGDDEISFAQEVHKLVGVSFDIVATDTPPAGPSLSAVAGPSSSVATGPSILSAL